MRYGRRRRGFPWGRAISISLTVLGALALLLLAVNWRSLSGLYRVNRVSLAVKRLEGALELDPAGLRTRRLSPEEATAQLERGLADLGVPSRLTARR
ncbi:MAG: hypothetical protein ACM3XZ_03445 [Betaproteobacteria bacterium]